MILTADDVPLQQLSCYKESILDFVVESSRKMWQCHVDSAVPHDSKPVEAIFPQAFPVSYISDDLLAAIEYLRDIPPKPPLEIDSAIG